jgi:hypothetical protein
MSAVFASFRRRSNGKFANVDRILKEKPADLWYNNQLNSILSSISRPPGHGPERATGSKNATMMDRIGHLAALRGC